MAKEKKEEKTKGKNAQHDAQKSVVATVNPIATRGRTFEGAVVKKFPKRVVIEFERTVFVQKYERFYKKRTRLHARLPDNIDAKVGDYVRIKECRPLSKIIHFIVLGKVDLEKNKGDKK